MIYKNWFKINDNWYHFNGLYLDGKEVSMKISFLLSMLFYGEKKEKSWWRKLIG